MLRRNLKVIAYSTAAIVVAAGLSIAFWSIIIPAMVATVQTGGLAGLFQRVVIYAFVGFPFGVLIPILLVGFANALSMEGWK